MEDPKLFELAKKIVEISSSGGPKKFRKRDQDELVEKSKLNPSERFVLNFIIYTELEKERNKQQQGKEVSFATERRG